MTEDYFRIFLHVHNSTHHARLHWFTTACSLGQSDRHLPLNISKSESPQSCPNLLYLLTLPSQEIKISSLFRSVPKLGVTIFYFLSYLTSNVSNSTVNSTFTIRPLFPYPITVIYSHCPLRHQLSPGLSQ